MARLPRFVLPGQSQHVIVRGINRQSIFNAEVDYLFYLEKLQLACEKHACDLHAYVLMSNHIHLLLTPHSAVAMSKFMQMLGRYYVQYFNATYQRTGTLWEGRYKATLVDSESYLLACYRYIELNPVRAEGRVDHASKYPWSSYRYNAMGEPNPLLVPHREYIKLGKTQKVRQRAYRALFRARIAEKTLTEIREATNKSWVLGSDKFKLKMAKQLDRPVAPKARGGDRKSASYKANS
ncbi:MAG: transposase [Pseudomonadales bacterium]|nr:transposase [Pseudomonadales bacterium]